jgi:hypothetical protein
VPIQSKHLQRWRSIAPARLSTSHVDATYLFVQDEKATNHIVVDFQPTQSGDCFVWRYPYDSEVGKLVLAELAVAGDPQLSAQQKAERILPPFALLDLICDLSPELRLFMSKFGFVEDK